MLKKQFYVEPQAEVLEVQGEAFVCASANYAKFNDEEDWDS